MNAIAQSSPVNPIATLETKATSESAQAKASVGLKVGQAITGQYLFNNFCVPDKAETTRMKLIEAWANPESGHGLAVDVLNTALKDMVESVKDDSEAIKKTAQNAASTIRAVYGALRFAGDDLAAAGYLPGKTGIVATRALAVKVLKSRGLHWTGASKKTEEERAREADNKAHKAAIEATMAANPQTKDESYGEYMQRIVMLAEDAKQSIDAELRAKTVEKLAEKVKALCGEHLADVLGVLADQQILAQGEDEPTHPTQGE